MFGHKTYTHQSRLLHCSPVRFSSIRIQRRVCKKWKGRSDSTRKQHIKCRPIKAVADVSESAEKSKLQIRGRTFVFACEDSEASEQGAEFLMNRLARPGDCVHFVHVISDNRAPFVSVGEVSCDSEDVFSFSSMDVNEAFPLEERQQCLEKSGEEMLKRRFLKTILQEGSSIETKFHLPILSRPESASEIASVVCDLAAELRADALSIVSPSSGVFFSYGSVGFHCYEQATVPVVFLPSTEMPPRCLQGNHVILLVVKTETERHSAVKWSQQHVAHAFEPYTFYVACVEDACSVNIPECNKPILTMLKENSEKIDPACAVLYFNDDLSVLQQLQQVPLVESYYEENKFPIVLLPRLHPQQHIPDSYWNDFAYSSHDILQI